MLSTDHVPPLLALLSATVQDYPAPRIEGCVPVQDLASPDRRQEMMEHV